MRHSIETVQTRPALKLEKLTPKQVLKGMLLTERVLLVAAPAVIHAKHIAMCLKTWVQLSLTESKLNWEIVMGNICRVMQPMACPKHVHRMRLVSV